jgi:hypothetical protein
MLLARLDPEPFAFGGSELAHELDRLPAVSEGADT